MNNLVLSRLMVVRGTVGVSFENATTLQKLTVKTESGSVYTIELLPGAMQNQRLGDATFTMRRGTVIINGRRYTDVSIGYSPVKGTLQVVDSVGGHVIRQSTAITQNESIR